jgi:hypothetical protein
MLLILCVDLERKRLMFESIQMDRQTFFFCNTSGYHNIIGITYHISSSTMIILDKDHDTYF